MKLARMRTCGGGGTSETAACGSPLLCCTCARGLRMPPCLSCSWKFPLSAEIAPCVAGVEIRGRARRPAVVSLSCTRLRQDLHRERKARERKNTALRPLLLVPSARLATSVERKGDGKDGCDPTTSAKLALQLRATQLGHAQLGGPQGGGAQLGGPHLDVGLID